MAESGDLVALISLGVGVALRSWEGFLLEPETKQKIQLVQEVDIIWIKNYNRS